MNCIVPMSKQIVFERPPKGFLQKAVIVGVYLFDIQRQRYLLLKHNDSSKSYVYKWGLPGGKVKTHATEDYLIAITREVREETGFSLSLNSVSYKRTLCVKYPNYDFKFVVYEYEGRFQDPTLSPEHSAFGWYDLSTVNDEIQLMPGQDEVNRLLYPHLFTPLKQTVQHR